MNQVAKEWVAALRSGEYSQTRKKLRTNEGYCCLGVLCELAAKHEVIGKSVKVSENFDGWFEYEGRTRSLPEVVRDWAGLTSMTGEFEEAIWHSLSEMNDKGSTFEQIADVIESNPKGLFVEEV